VGDILRRLGARSWLRGRHVVGESPKKSEGKESNQETCTERPQAPGMNFSCHATRARRLRCSSKGQLKADKEMLRSSCDGVNRLCCLLDVVKRQNDLK
jgi:hypothetical protein